MSRDEGFHGSKFIHRHNRPSAYTCQLVMAAKAAIGGRGSRRTAPKPRSFSVVKSIGSGNKKPLPVYVHQTRYCPFPEIRVDGKRASNGKYTGAGLYMFRAMHTCPIRSAPIQNVHQSFIQDPILQALESECGKYRGIIALYCDVHSSYLSMKHTRRHYWTAA